MKIGKILFVLALFFGLGVVARAEDEIPLAITTREYPHIESIRSGTIHIPECRISYTTMTAADLNRHFDRGSAGDVIEVDFASYLKRYTGEEKHDWVLVPVFLLREFPQRHVIVNQNHLALDYANNSLRVWAKGILDSSSTEKSAGHVWDQTISTSQVSQIRLFPDSKTVEQDYFRETRIFPIITVLAVRAELVKENPWVPEALFIAFSEAKDKALEAGTIPLPWGPEHRDETVELMKKNYWSYGVKNNPKTLEAFFKYAHEQGFTKEEMTPEDVFAPETLSLIDEKGAKN